MTGPTARLVPFPALADARAGIRHVFVRDLVLNCSIGVYDHEREAPQRVRINLDLAVYEHESPLNDDLGRVVCYESISDKVRALMNRGHVNLVETMAEDIAAVCLDDRRVRSVRVRVEKLDVFADAASVGVEIERFNAEG